PQKLEKIENLILNSLRLLKKKEFDKALSIIDNILNEKTTQISLSQKFGARIVRLLALMSLKSYDQVNEEIKFCEEILNQMESLERENHLVKEGEGRLLFVKGGIQTIHGDLESSLESYHHSLAIYETLGNNKGMIYQQLLEK
ncbi:unnamed protein product, partial [marine sediment metagenome]